MIRIVTAMRPEAQPIVARYGMKAREGAFAWYASEGEAEALVVSGVGKRAAAAATAYLHARSGEAEQAVWLNVGIAGHALHAPGELLLAHTVRDAATGERWYPTRLPIEAGSPDLRAAEIVSVDRPETRFASEAGYDMEAAGFYPTALRFTTCELAQVLKVTSDNQEQSFTLLTAERVSGLVEGALDAVASLARRLGALRSTLPAPPGAAEVEAFARRWRFTTSERRKLTRLLVRWKALEPASARTPEALRGASASEAIADLEKKLRSLALERPV